MKNIKPFWDDEYKHLKYHRESYNYSPDIEKWKKQGYNHEHFTGEMCPHNEKQPSWNKTFIEWAEIEHGLKDVGCCYYRMKTGIILPIHSDAYILYKKKFNCEVDNIYRVLVFLEDWKSGHYLEFDGKPVVSWKAGNYAKWKGEVEHMAANIGIEDRYTLQITGHKNG